MGAVQTRTQDEMSAQQCLGPGEDIGHFLFDGSHARTLFHPAAKWKSFSRAPCAFAIGGILVAPAGVL
jgi:hypothetical protein